MREPKAFTLVELLVVVAIISLLVCILVPVVQAAIEQGRAACCLTHLHNVGTAAVQYVEDSDQYIPRGNDCLWFQVFLPYLTKSDRINDYRNVPVYRCPSFPVREQTVCYVDNSWTFESPRDPMGREILEPTPLEQFTSPGETIYLADNEHGWWRPIITGLNAPDMYRHDVWRESHLPRWDIENILTGRRVARDRHRDGANCMYVDGHAGWVGARKMKVEMWRDRR